MSTYLNQNFGYAREDMVILTDDQQNPMSQPTKANILRAMHWLVKDAQPNDSLFFHYSGRSLKGFNLDLWESDVIADAFYTQATEVKQLTKMVMRRTDTMR